MAIDQGSKEIIKLVHQYKDVLNGLIDGKNYFFEPIFILHCLLQVLDMVMLFFLTLYINAVLTVKAQNDCFVVKKTMIERESRL